MAQHRDRRPGSWHAYVKDFKADEGGGYTYEGRMLHSSRELPRYREEIRKAAAAFTAVLIAQLAAGFVPETGMEGHVLMLLPYALGIGCAARILWILVRLMQNGNSLREYVYKATAEKLPGYLIAAQVLSAAFLADTVICLVRGTFRFGGAASLVPGIAQILLLAASHWAWRIKPAGDWIPEESSGNSGDNIK